MMKPRYVVCPGEVTSQTDGQRHYIGAMQLMRLYGVRPEECEIYEPAPWWPESYYRMAEERQQGMPRLYPRYNGNYSLPSNAEVRGATPIGGAALSTAGLAGETGGSDDKI